MSIYYVASIGKTYIHYVSKKKSNNSRGSEKLSNLSKVTQGRSHNYQMAKPRFKAWTPFNTLDASFNTIVLIKKFKTVFCVFWDSFISHNSSQILAFNHNQVLTNFEHILNFHCSGVSFILQYSLEGTPEKNFPSYNVHFKYYFLQNSFLIFSIIGFLCSFISTFFDKFS